ncbi:hypothetical protein B9Z55_009700 [Caenorhabditis nigoni]|uniref:Uncharacterized protein n=1 Tax=Caenorhabditis nigoni TaxID=1611254 RepID=A0A2G5UTB9_9PELO|nr:hypothetical protein B9Z55_009700 [Caenorhabditis nigoni]
MAQRHVSVGCFSTFSEAEAKVRRCFQSAIRSYRHKLQGTNYCNKSEKCENAPKRAHNTNISNKISLV